MKPRIPKQHKIVRNQPQPVGAPSKDEIARLVAEHASTEAKTLEAAIVAFLRQGVPFGAIEIVHESAMGEVETEEGHRLKLVSRAYVRVKPGYVGDGENKCGYCSQCAACGADHPTSDISPYPPPNTSNK